MPIFTPFKELSNPKKLRRLIELRELTKQRYRRSYRNAVSLSQYFNEPSFFVGREFPDIFITEIRNKCEELKATIASVYSQSIRRLEITSNELAPGTFDMDLSQSFDWDAWKEAYERWLDLVNTMAEAAEDGHVSQEERAAIRDAAEAHRRAMEDVYPPQP